MTIPLPGWLVRWVMRRAFRTPFFNLHGYMNRWWFFGGGARDDRDAGERGWTGSALDRFLGRFIAVRLHQILRSDDERDLHDHPWPFMTIILSGGYWEVTPLDQGAGSALRLVAAGAALARAGLDHLPSRDRPAPAAHTGGPHGLDAVLQGPQSQQWGFYMPSGKVPAPEYITPTRTLKGKGAPAGVAHAA
jgi:hypothetical protein